MSKKWTRKEFEAKKKTLDAKKMKKKQVSNIIETAMSAAITMGLSGTLYKLADLTY